MRAAFINSQWFHVNVVMFRNFTFVTCITFVMCMPFYLIAWFLLKNLEAKWNHAIQIHCAALYFECLQTDRQWIPDWRTLEGMCRFVLMYKILLSDAWRLCQGWGMHPSAEVVNLKCSVSSPLAHHPRLLGVTLRPHIETLGSPFLAYVLE